MLTAQAARQVVLNGAFWTEGSPRLLTKQQLAALRRQLETQGRGHQRMLSVIDVACDFDVSRSRHVDMMMNLADPYVQGGLEFVERATTIDEPVFYLDADGNEHSELSCDLLLLITKISKVNVI